MSIWVQFVIGPVIVLLAGLLVKQLSVIRKENTEQHAKGQENIGLLIDSHHNLTGKVDSLVDKIDSHIQETHPPRTYRKKPQ